MTGKRGGRVKKLPKPLPEADAIAIVDACLADPNVAEGRFDHVMTCLLLHGLRVSEAANLQVEHVDLTDDRPSLMVREGKGGVDRRIPIDDQLAISMRQHLRTLRGDIRSTGYVLHTRGDLNRPITRRTIDRRLKARAIQAGIANASKVHAHRLRHTFAVRWLKRGGNLRTLQKLLGHHDLATSEVYLEVSGKYVGDEAERLGMMG